MIGLRRLARDPAAWVAAVSALGFLVLAAIVNGQGYAAFDQAVIGAVQGLPIPTGVWEAITAAGGVMLIPIGVAVVAWLLLGRQYRLAVVVAIALIGGSLFTEVVKQFVARPRPPGQPVVFAPGYSFPSGHTLNSAVTYGLVALVAWRSALPLTVRRTIVALLAALVAAVGLSRIALGVHYPGDVLTGWLAGTAIVATVVVVTHLLNGGRATAVVARAPTRLGGPPPG